jgi:hypothetical protein
MSVPPSGSSVSGKASSPATIIAHLLNAASKNTAWTFTTITQALAHICQVHPRRTIGWSTCSALSSARLDTVRTQFGVTASAGQCRGNVEVWNSLRDQAGSRNLVFDLAFTHERFGSSSHSHASAGHGRASAYCSGAQDE